MNRSTVIRTVLALAFLLSGAAGLWYESVWTRYLGLFVGHAAYAQVLVLVIFLGGMALGAWLVGRRSSDLARPLLLYGLAESVVGLLGLFFHEIYGAVTGWAYSAVFPNTGEGLSLVLARWGIAALLILPQSILLGTTFPLMTAGALRRIETEPGRSIASLYFSNSLGAAIGVLIAGFYLIGAAGLPGVVAAAAALNFIAAFIAVGMELVPSAPSAPSASSASPAPSILLIVALATALASFFYEIAWTRMLSLVLSSATHSFEMMLSAFILGLALGAWWIRSRLDRLTDPIRTLALVQWVMGLMALLTLPVYLQSFEWTSALIRGLAHNDSGYGAFNLARYGIALLVILPATFCAGMTLPLIIHLSLKRGAGEQAIGRLYAANTFGSIVGVVLAGLVLLPLIGLKWLMVAGALLDMALAVVLLVTIPEARRLTVAATAGLIAVGLIAALGLRLDRNLLASGVYRYGVIPQPNSRELRYYRDGRTASVSAVKIKATGETFIATNGKSDGALPAYWSTPCTPDTPLQPLRSDVANFTLSPLITLAHRPDAKVAAVIGQGTGMSSHFLLGSPWITDLYTIEIEPEMIEASRVFYPHNRRAFDDRRSHFVIDDARSYFAAGNRKYDLIFSEPSEPWVSGISSLFTRQFYRQVAGRLSPNGVFGQWLHLYDINDRLVLTVLTAMHESFNDYQIFMPSATDMLVVATNGDSLGTPEWGILEQPEILQDLCHQLPLSREALEALRLGNRRSLGPMVAENPLINSDYFPLLDLGAERARFLGQTASGFYSLATERFDPSAPFAGRRTGPVSFTQAPVAEVPRPTSLALGASLRGPQRPWADSSPSDDAQAAAFRDRSWQALLASPLPPSNWRLWLRRMAEAETLRYGGTSGFADSLFYQEIEHYLDRHSAPPEARAAVDFRRAVSGWDFPNAVTAAEPLIAAARQQRPWIPADELREGATVAHLMTGDAAGARRVFVWLSPFSTRGPADFRSVLLLSYLDSRRSK